ncbi:unnamed protein product [Timema podura]|uniref:Uncharacterized protein n=1 Tax=Timema podura TaxID=61482 RepID=A0ABN7P8J2_TIMPD|nr:unnamed protein product [Timema podura]
MDLLRWGFLHLKGTGEIGGKLHLTITHISRTTFISQPHTDPSKYFFLKTN